VIDHLFTFFATSLALAVVSFSKFFSLPILVLSFVGVRSTRGLALSRVSDPDRWGNDHTVNGQNFSSCPTLLLFDGLGKDLLE